MKKKQEESFFLNKIKNTELILALGVLFILLVMIVPFPAWIMDLLFVASFSVSIGILLLSIYTVRPLDFSVFPTVLLFSTLFRLSLNIASTRLILLHGHESGHAAGYVIESFGKFVIGGNYVVGVVVFVLLIIINFTVITKGSGRVAEVAARFILDAMPGKQMSIDADLNAGLITEEEAKERRKKIEREADFYGSMDGASKFVRGDAIAGILITITNIIGGFSIGVFQKNLELLKAAEIYTLMTIGDGLVAQIPSLIVSTAAGIIVTRTASSENFSEEISKQFFSQPRVLFVTGAILFCLGLLPNIPFFPFFVLSILICLFGVFSKNRAELEEKNKFEEEKRKNEILSKETNIPPEIDTLELQVGFGLISMVEGEKKTDLVERIFQLRKEFAKELGIIIPKVRIKDNLELQPTEYSILIRGVSVGKGELASSQILAIDPGTVTEKILGVETKEPVFGLSAVWISEKQKEKAQACGYTVVDHSTIIATHLSEIIRKNAYELIGRQDLQLLIENIQKTHPKVVEELIPNLLPLGSVLKICQNLLKEQVPIRDLRSVLECLANHASQTKDLETLTEQVRMVLSRTITNTLMQENTELEVVTLNGELEGCLLRCIQKSEVGSTFHLEPGFLEKIITGTQHILESTVFSSGTPVLLCHPHIRFGFKRMIERFLPSLIVISPNEVASFAKVRCLGTIQG